MECPCVASSASPRPAPPPRRGRCRGGASRHRCATGRSCPRRSSPLGQNSSAGAARMETARHRPVCIEERDLGAVGAGPFETRRATIGCEQARAGLGRRHRPVHRLMAAIDQRRGRDRAGRQGGGKGPDHLVVGALAERHPVLVGRVALPHLRRGRLPPRGIGRRVPDALFPPPVEAVVDHECMDGGCDRNGRGHHGNSAIQISKVQLVLRAHPGSCDLKWTPVLGPPG